jgi:hypothetical protein
MTRASGRPDAVNREAFISFYVGFYLPKDEAQYRMFLEHWQNVAVGLKQKQDAEYERLRGGGAKPNANGNATAAAPAAGSAAAPASAPVRMPPSPFRPPPPHTFAHAV